MSLHHLIPSRGRWLRHMAYGAMPSPVIRTLKRLAGVPEVHQSGTWWDGELEGRMSAPSLNGRIGNALRDAVTVHLVRHCGPRPYRVLDVGCGLCSVAEALADLGLRRYVGVDLSGYAVDRARREHARWSAAKHCAMRFHQADLREFTPGMDDGGPFDVIIFNEVLKYVEPDEAGDQAARYASCLALNGMLCVTLSDDAKSRAVFRVLHRRFEWVYGTLYQQCPDRPRYRLRHHAAAPPYLIGLFAPRKG